jgi:signal transduction histidine kinase
MLDEAGAGVHRIAALVRHLKVFSRAQPQPSRPFAINDVVESAITLVQNEIRHRATLSLGLGSALPEVFGEPQRIEQVLVNVFINAAQSIPPGDVSGNTIRVTTHPAAAGEVVIEISDTGCGISPEDLERAFEAFYTTKPVGEGTGLGLAICHSIVEAHRGRMSIDSEVGSGTTVTIALPTHPAPA